MRPEHGSNEKLPAFLASVPDRGCCTVLREGRRDKMIVRGEHGRGDMNGHVGYLVCNSQEPGTGCSIPLQDVSSTVVPEGLCGGTQVSHAQAPATTKEPRHTHQYSGQK